MLFRLNRIMPDLGRTKAKNMDGWQSGLSRPVANRVSPAKLRGFESRPIHQLNQGTRTGALVHI